MKNFEQQFPTRVLFGKDSVEKLTCVLPEGAKRILVTSGKGSVKKIGLYDKVMELLKGYQVFELSGIPSNPKLDFVYEGIEICRNNQIETIVAVGGGSVIDCSKVIAASVKQNADPWEMIMVKRRIPAGGSLPMIAIPTMAATGTEVNTSSVVVKEDEGQKKSLYGVGVMPYASLLDPTYTFSIPAFQTAAGCVDIMSHVMEPYFVKETNYLSDLLSEAVMKTIVRYAKTAIEEPDNYEARSQILWASEIGDNGTVCAGNSSDACAVHWIEHEISGHFDTTHGAGLAVLTPNWMRYVLSDDTAPRFAHFGEAVLGLEKAGDDMEMAKRTITALREFFNSLGMPSTLSEMGVTKDKFDEMADGAVKRGTPDAWVPLEKEDVLKILEMSF